MRLRTLYRVLFCRLALLLVGMVVDRLPWRPMWLESNSGSGRPPHSLRASTLTSAEITEIEDIGIGEGRTKRK